MPTIDTEQSRTLARRYFDELRNKQDVAAVPRLFHESIAFPDPAIVPDGEAHGHQEVANFFTVFFHAFPDLHFTMNDLFAEGERAAVRFT